MIAVTVAVLLGILAGLFVPYNLSSETLPYVAVGIIAAMDTVFGGIWANMNRRFKVGMFISGLISNALLAIAFIFMGNKLGIDLSLAVVVVFGVRIFNNLSSIRRYLFERYYRIRKIRQKYIESTSSYTGNEEEGKIEE